MLLTVVRTYIEVCYIVLRTPWQFSLCAPAALRCDAYQKDSPALALSSFPSNRKYHGTQTNHVFNTTQSSPGCGSQIRSTNLTVPPRTCHVHRQTPSKAGSCLIHTHVVFVSSRHSTLYRFSLSFCSISFGHPAFIALVTLLLPVVRVTFDVYVSLSRREQHSTA
jgi:hypothetical protein